MYKFCNNNQDFPLSTQDLLDEKLYASMLLTFSTSLILIKNLIIPKMFPNGNIPKELKGNKLKDKLKNYLIDNEQKNPNFQYQLNVVGNQQELQILDKTLKDISIDALGRDNAFKI